MNDREGGGRIVVERVGLRSAATAVSARSPLKLLLPNNHGDAQWIFSATFGGGLVDGDAIDLSVEVGAGASAFVSTQASTKVYRSPRGTSQSLTAHVGAGALLAVVPDPVACFAGARYAQRSEITLDERGSLVFVDSLTCGRAAHGERWDFARYASRTTVGRKGGVLVTDATRLEPEDGDLHGRMGRFDALATVLVFGERAQTLRAAILAPPAEPDAPGASAITAASPIGEDGAILRVAATSTAGMLAALRGALAPLAATLGDDPFARKW